MPGLNPLVLTSWSAVSAAGLGAQPFAAALQPEHFGQFAETRCVPGFDIPRLLGRKNTRTMDRITGLTVLTVRLLLDRERASGQEVDGSTTGLVLGTSGGSIQSMMDFSRDSFTQAKPYLVDPARFPNAVMNCAAGHSAIWHGLRGPNTTIASGQVAGLSVLRYAARLLRSGHARSVLCGAVEELTPLRTWLESMRGNASAHTEPGEGCAIFRLETLDDAHAAGRIPLAQLAATAFRVASSPADVPRALAECVTSVLKTEDGDTGDVWALATDLSPAHYVLPSEAMEPAQHISLTERLGDTGAASAALHLAALLARADHTVPGRLALVAAADRDGLVGAAAVRFLEPSR